LKVGIVTRWLERGAAYVSRQYRKTLAKDFKVFIYARGGEQYAKGDPNWDDSAVYWSQRKYFPPVPAAIDKIDFVKWVKKNDIKIILFNEQQWWEPVIWAKELGVMVGAYVDYYTKETVEFFNCYDFLICNTKRHYKVFDKNNNCLYVPWGTDLNLFKPERHNPVDDNKVTFFHSCGVSPERKGTKYFLEQAIKIKDKANYFVHSQIDLKKVYPDLKRSIYELETSGCLKIINKTVAAPGLYNKGDVYVYPSLLEGIGLTIAEALASGLPVIVSDNPPMNEFIDDSAGRKTKIASFKERADKYYWPQCIVDSDSLFENMMFYVENINSLAEYKRSARKYAEQKLDWGKNSEILNQFIKNIKQANSLDEELLKKIRNYESKKYGILYKIYKACPRFFNKLIYNIYRTIKMIRK